MFTTPAIRALRYNLPQAQIIILANRLAAEVYKHNPYQIEVINCIDQWDLLKKLVEIRKLGLDLALGLSQIGSFFTRFCGAPYRSDFFAIPHQSRTSVVKLCLDVIAETGLAANTYETEFWYNESEQKRVELVLKNLGCQSEKPLLAIHCGGHYFSRKRWPFINFIKLIRTLVNESAYQVILVGGEADREDVNLIQSMLPGVLSVAGVFTIGETAAFLKKCRLLIANDSGPLHLGAAVHVPTIGLFGPTSPAQFYPYRSPTHRYIYKELSCSPCYRFGGGLWQYLPRCSKPYCMQAISVDEILEMVLGETVGATPALVEVT